MLRLPPAKGSVLSTFAFTDDQLELRRTVRGFCERRSPEHEVRRLMETTAGYDPAVWTSLATELGVVGLAVPEDLGGSGGGILEQLVVLEELGRRLVCAPYLASAVLATHTLVESADTAAQERWLPALAAGEMIATLAVAEESGRWDPTGIATTAQLDGSGWRVSGVKSYVLDGTIADLLLVAARTPDGVSLFAIEANADGVTRTALQTVDLTRKLARIEFARTPATPVATIGGGTRTLERVLEVAVTALAAEQVGGAQVALDMAVDYAKQRVQFGRPIGSFQAVKHRCADMLLEVESARTAAYYAGWCIADDTADRSEAVSVAKSSCSAAYVAVAAGNIQVHGGIGFTWEHPAQLYFKRAKSSEALFGQPSRWREQLAGLIGL
ncbi:MAG TPA: acyl-CoA dehydrogenase family protein [Mycobacteriales bacterium]|nr:acyl-CoA dehydrogenase family protein [Mycobacteriales bacterium]